MGLVSGGGVAARFSVAVAFNRTCNFPHIQEGQSSAEGGVKLQPNLAGERGDWERIRTSDWLIQNYSLLCAPPELALWLSPSSFNRTHHVLCIDYAGAEGRFGLTNQVHQNVSELLEI